MVLILQMNAEAVKTAVEVLRAEIKNLEGNPENSDKIDQLNEVLREMISELETEQLLHEDLSLEEIPGEKEEEPEQVLNVYPGESLEDLGINVIYEVEDEKDGNSN